MEARDGSRAPSPDRLNARFPALRRIAPRAIAYGLRDLSARVAGGTAGWFGSGTSARRSALQSANPIRKRVL
jgi:hypothetical protein